MTVTRLRPALAAPDIDAATAAVRAHGMRVTESRLRVIEALFSAEGAVTAAEIADGLGGARSPVDRASVYDNLEALEAVGLVRHVHLGHGPGLYALADRVATEHLHCDRCGVHEAVPSSVLAGARTAIADATGWRASFVHFPVVGLCPACTTARRTDGL